MQALTDFLDVFPVVTFTFVVVVCVGAFKSVNGDLDYGEFIEYVKALGIGLGAIGGARALAKVGTPTR